MTINNLYLIDTDIIIYWLKNRFPSINKKFTTLEKHCIFISSITVAELYYGAYNSSKIRENLELVRELISEMNIVDFDSKAGERFGKIKANLKSRGEIINDSDLFIASIGISNRLTLVTNNENHFRRIDGLEIENWANPR
jgi:tRNA(fMet)-specific endonuclease VapC